MGGKAKDDGGGERQRREEESPLGQVWWLSDTPNPEQRQRRGGKEMVPTLHFLRNWAAAAAADMA